MITSQQMMIGLLAACMTACGSTAIPGAQTGAVPAGGSVAPELGIGSTTAPVDPSGAETSTVPDEIEGSSAQPDGSAGSGTPQLSTPESAGEDTGSVAAAAAPAVSSDPVRLSYVVLDSSGTSAFAIDTGNDANSSTRAADEEMQALITWANGNGGIGGRRIIGRGTKVSATSSQDERQAVCTRMTEDEKAQVVIDVSVMIRPDQFACFAKHQTVLSGVATTTDSAVMRTFSPYLQTTWSALDRQLVALSSAAIETRWAKGEKVAVVYNDDLPEVRRNVDQVLIPRLKAGGVDIVDRQGMAGRSEDAALASNQAAGAVLRFRQNRVTRIFFVAGAIEYLAFTGQAKSQSYRPSYAFPDYQVISGVAAFYGTEQDNAGAIATSTSATVVAPDNSRRSTDLSSDFDRARATPGLRRCLDLMTKIMGRNYYRPSSSQSSQFELYYCEHFLSWLDAARTLGAAWTPKRHGEAMRRLAKAYPPVLNNTVDWSAGRPDGASSYRVGRYDPQCKCFVGAGPWRPLA